MQLATRFMVNSLAGFFLVGFPLVLFACSPEEPQPKQFVLFVDSSASITAENSSNWLPMAAQAMANFQAGDKVTVYELPDQTRNNNFAYEGEVKPLRPRAGLDESQRVRREVSKVKNEALQKVAANRSDARRSLTSDIFGPNDRLHPDPQRHLIRHFSLRLKTFSSS